MSDKTSPRKPTRTNLSVLAQICNSIPGHLVARLAREHRVDTRSRTFSPWSHVVALLYAQLAHSLSLNDVCDALKHHAGRLVRIRDATPPSKNALSHANRNRDGAMAEALFHELLAHLSVANPAFGKRRMKMPRRFKRAIHAVDASTVELVANCMDWARHRRRKAAAKLHLRLNLQSFLPAFAIVDTAAQHDNTRARELCAGLREGEIAVLDKAYVDFEHLFDLTRRGVFWVTRAKENMSCHVRKRLIRKARGGILRDDLIVLTGPKSKQKYSGVLRRVIAMVEVDGKEHEMTFLTNNTEWAPSSVADLYRCRWQIEVFFKEIKQTLQLCDFLGHNRNAVIWQVWTALILHLLLRFLAFVHGWAHGFKRWLCLMRSALWDSARIDSIARIHGTAGGIPRVRAAPEMAYLPGFGGKKMPI